MSPTFIVRVFIFLSLFILLTISYPPCYGWQLSSNNNNNNYYYYLCDKFSTAATRKVRRRGRRKRIRRTTTQLWSIFEEFNEDNREVSDFVTIPLEITSSSMKGAETSTPPPPLTTSSSGKIVRELPKSLAQLPLTKKDKIQISQALAKLESDTQMLDIWTGETPQLSGLEVVLLACSVLAAGSGPVLFGGHITELLAPSAAAFCAAISVGAEYAGKVAVADGKEVAAKALQCAAEAEALLANAERAKAITPLCVGIGATSATISLLVPTLVDALGFTTSQTFQFVTEVYLLCPLISVMSAAVSSLALQETRQYAQRAIGIGNRRFARSGLVGRTWLSTSEQVQAKSLASRRKWRTFCASVIPAPILGSLIPGTFATKTIVISALAAAESAYFLTQAEYTLAQACDAVALKARTSAISDTYANQGARSAGLLPFTSALATLCAAATAAIVELPLFGTTTTALGVAGQVATATFFPMFSALFAGAASVSKARCQVDAEAAVMAASTLAIEYGYGEDKNDRRTPVVRPVSKVRELIVLTIQSFLATFRRQSKYIRKFASRRLRKKSKFLRSIFVRLQKGLLSSSSSSSRRSSSK